MTQSYAHSCDDDVFLQEHFVTFFPDGGGEIKRPRPSVSLAFKI
jgi:hypothetical protein